MANATMIAAVAAGGAIGAYVRHQCYCRFWHLAQVFGRIGIVENGNE